jgi:hypothetical protein
MPRIPLTKERLAELMTNRHKYGGGIAEVQMKGLTEQQENEEMKNTFEEIWAQGYEHIHTLRIVPSDGREPYYVHVSTLNG